MSYTIAKNIEFYLHILDKTNQDTELLQKYQKDLLILNEKNQQNVKIIKNLLVLKEE